MTPTRTEVDRLWREAVDATRLELAVRGNPAAVAACRAEAARARERYRAALDARRPSNRVRAALGAVVRRDWGAV